MPQVSTSKVLRLARNIAYPEQIWWFIATFIGLLALLHLANTLILRHRRQSLLNVYYGDSPADPESTHRTLKASLFKRLVSSITESLSILLYCYTIPIGGRQRANFAETGIVVAYITICLTWTFINCMYSSFENKIGSFKAPPRLGYSQDSGLKLDPLFWANRAGNIVTSHIPLLVLLAGKNNFLSRKSPPPPLFRSQRSHQIS